MKKKIAVLVLVAMFLAQYSSAEAQQVKKIPRIGYLGNTAASSLERIDGFRHGLRELGYVEGKNILIEYRYEGNFESERVLTAELLRLKLDIIVTGGAGATRTAKAATSTIPIVMGGTHCGRFREDIRGAKHGAPGWTLRARWTANNR